MARELTRHTWRVSDGWCHAASKFSFSIKNLVEMWMKRDGHDDQIKKKKGERELLVAAISLCREWFAVRLLLHASLLT